MADGYRVRPDAVQAVLGDTASALSAIGKAARPLPAAFSGSGASADGTNGSGLITAALRALDEEVASALAVMTTRLPSASLGLRDATQAVISGDGEMAVQVRSGEAASLPSRGGNGRWMK